MPDLDVEAQELSDAMTLSGSHVEGFVKKDKNLEKIVVGKIVKMRKHPDADKLVICQVNIGAETASDRNRSTKCKRRRHGTGCLDGGKVAGGHDGGELPADGIKIKKGKLRGVESYGMMCSIEELGSSRELCIRKHRNTVSIFSEEM